MVRGRRKTWALGMLASAWAFATSGAHGTEPLPGVIEGVAYDSLLTKRPLQGATVYIIGTTLVATTDPRGRFSIGGVPYGSHTLTFSHPVFDSAGVQAPQVAVDVASGSMARVYLASPSAASLVKAWCRGAQSEDTGLLLGVDRDVESGAPLPGARVV